MPIAAPPLTPLKAKSRQVAFSALTEFKRDFFKFAFPGFFDTALSRQPERLSPDTDPSTPAGLVDALRQLHTPFRNARRYAGDFLTLFGPQPSDLGRGCYHALASPGGSDQGLLRSELLAYADFKATGGFRLFDLLIERHREELNGYAKRNAFVLLLDKPTGSKLFETLCGQTIEPERIGKHVGTTFDARFARFSAERALDLRRPEARVWFHETFSDFGRLKGPLDPMLAEALANVPPPGPGFEYMLPTLRSSHRGGGWQSQVIGIVLRRLGIEVLVFPSARCDVEVTVHNGRVVDWRGWNAIDYRKAPPPLDIEQSGYLFAAMPIYGSDAPDGQYRGRDYRTDEAMEIGRLLTLGDSFWGDLGNAQGLHGGSSRPEFAGSFKLDGLEWLADT